MVVYIVSASEIYSFRAGLEELWDQNPYCISWWARLDARAGRGELACSRSHHQLGEPMVSVVAAVVTSVAVSSCYFTTALTFKANATCFSSKSRDSVRLYCFCITFIETPGVVFISWKIHNVYVVEMTCVQVCVCVVFGLCQHWDYIHYSLHTSHLNWQSFNLTKATMF